MVRSSAPDEVVTVKALAEVAVPLGVVTEIAPVVAAAGTLVVIWLALVTAKVAAVPLNFTEVVPVKLVPLMVTEAAADPLVGEKAGDRGRGRYGFGRGRRAASAASAEIDQGENEGDQFCNCFAGRCAVDGHIHTIL